MLWWRCDDPTITMLLVNIFYEEPEWGLCFSHYYVGTNAWVSPEGFTPTDEIWDCWDIPVFWLPNWRELSLCKCRHLKQCLWGCTRAPRLVLRPWQPPHTSLVPMRVDRDPLVHLLCIEEAEPSESLSYVPWRVAVISAPQRRVSKHAPFT